MANLDWAFLPGADLREADLRGAKLRALLYYADLRNTDLRGADLRGQGLGVTHRGILAGTNLTGARYDRTTRWPLWFDPVAHGCVPGSEPAKEVTPAPSREGRGDEPSPAERSEP